MKKNILIISSSLRANSNSEALAASFAKGAQEAGHSVKQISLKGKSISFCRGCLACQTSENCTIRDDATEIVQMMHDADTIVFATPFTIMDYPAS